MDSSSRHFFRWVTEACVGDPKRGCLFRGIFQVAIGMPVATLRSPGRAGCSFSNWSSNLGFGSYLKSRYLRKHRAVPLAAIPLFALLCNCTGITSQGSGPNSSDTHDLSGTITPQTIGNGAKVALSGPISASVTGNSSGNYSFSGIPDGNYVVAPSRSGYSFSPSLQSVAINGSDVSGINFTAVQQSNHSVQLTWHDGGSNIVGYNVYRSTSNGGPYVKINAGIVSALAYTDTSVGAATNYYYVTTAVDAAGIESAYSNQASAVIP
jgi:hypothetical protein